MDETYVYRDVRCNTIARHQRALLEASLPSLEGRSIRVQYKDGSATVTDTA
ncbi:KfrB domain-containing protein [Noviherbaspirillum soli]